MDDSSIIPSPTSKVYAVNAFVNGEAVPSHNEAVL